jgi:hypothetical protein
MGDLVDAAVGYDEWGDALDGLGNVLPSSIESNSIASAPAGWLSAPISDTTSWTGLASSLPAVVQTGIDAAKAISSISLAKDQISTNNALQRAALQQQQYAANAQTGVAQYQAAAKIAGAQAQAQFASLLSNPVILIALIGGAIMLIKSK